MVNEEAIGEHCIVFGASKSLEEAGEGSESCEGSRGLGEASTSLSVSTGIGGGQLLEAGSSLVLDCNWLVCISVGNHGFEYLTICTALSLYKRFSGECALKRMEMLLLVLSVCESVVAMLEKQLAGSVLVTLVLLSKLVTPIDCFASVASTTEGSVDPLVFTLRELVARAACW